jgi:hypothetical protein
LFSWLAAAGLFLCPFVSAVNLNGFFGRKVKERKSKDMDWLQIEYIKKHSRLDYENNTDLMKLYANDAEKTILRLIRRTLDNVKDMNGGEVPEALYHAALMLTDVAWEHRNPQTQAQLHNVDYTFECIISDFIRYTNETDLQAERDYLLEMLTGVESDLDFEYDSLESPSDEITEAYITEKGVISGVFERYQKIINPTSNICAALRKRVAEIEKDCKDIFNEE